jgi:protein gp37
MAGTTEIVWCDSTFNSWIGCTKVSPGCDHCYAETLMDKRYHRVQWGAGNARSRTSTANWKEPLKWNRQHDAFVAEHGRRRRVFCSSLADVFDNEVPQQWRDDLFDLIEMTPNLDWLLLTKRIGNVNGSMLKSGDWFAGQRNVSLGITVVNQDEADRDIPKLLKIPARVRFLSIEPMLGPILLDSGGTSFLSCSGVQADGYCCVSNEMSGDHFHGIDWVIAGGESGRNARPSHPEWYRSLRDQCAAAGVPFLFKQWGEWAPYDRGATDSRLRVTGGALDEPMQRFNKKLAGRLLDGAEHNGFPK